MNISDNIKTVPESEIIEKGVCALINELGYTGYMKFMRMFEHGEGNYLHVQMISFKIRAFVRYLKMPKHWNDAHK